MRQHSIGFSSKDIDDEYTGGNVKSLKVRVSRCDRRNFDWDAIWKRSSFFSYSFIVFVLWVSFILPFALTLSNGFHFARFCIHASHSDLFPKHWKFDFSSFFRSKPVTLETSWMCWVAVNIYLWTLHPASIVTAANLNSSVNHPLPHYSPPSLIIWSRF